MMVMMWDERTYHEPKPLSFFRSCSGSRFCLSGVGVVGEDVGIDIGEGVVRGVEGDVEKEPDAEGGGY